MKFSVRKSAFFLYSASVFMFAFEQASTVLFGIDSPLKPYRLLVLLSAALLFSLPIKLGRKSRNLMACFLAIYGFGVLLAIGRSIIYSTDIFVTMHQAQLFLVAFLFYIIPVSIIQKPEQIARIAVVILISAILSAGIAFFERYDTTLYRFAGFFRNPNHFAYLISLSLIISFYFFTIKVSRPIFFASLLAWLFTGTLLLILSGSRGAFAAIAVAMILFLYRYTTLPGRRPGTRSVIGLGIVIAFVAVLPPLLSSNLISGRILDRFLVDQLETGAGRFDIWKAGLLAAEDSLYTGIGMGQYLAVHSFYIRQVGGSVYQTVLDFDLGLHSEYVNLLVEFGFFSLVAYVLAIFFVWRCIWEFGRKYRDWLHLCAFLESALILNFLFSATQDMYAFPYGWAVLGVCASLINLRERRITAEAQSPHDVLG